jgi:uncharacterized protein YeaO (DUF488 family)
MIRIRRVYDTPQADEGRRYLVDRFWPRGVKKEALGLADWQRAAAPSRELCHWFGHEPARWEEFRRRYFAELDGNPAAWAPLLAAARAGTLTLLFAARDVEHNNAVALLAYLEKFLVTN